MYRIMDLPPFLAFDPVPLRAQHNGWTPALQKRFILALARGAGPDEAARSLGMPAGMATRKVVLPQAFRIVTPPLTNELILLVKDSSLAYILGLSQTGYELTKYGRDLSSTNANLTPLVVAGLCYLVITLPLTVLVKRLEARAKKAR